MTFSMGRFGRRGQRRARTHYIVEQMIPFFTASRLTHCPKCVIAFAN